MSRVESVPFAVPCRTSDLALPGLAQSATTGVFLWHLLHGADGIPERTSALCCPSSLNKGHNHEGTAAGTPIQSAQVASLGRQRVGEATIILLGQLGEVLSDQASPLWGSGPCPPYLDSLVLPGGPSFSLSPKPLLCARSLSTKVTPPGTSPICEGLNPLSPGETSRRAPSQPSYSPGSSGGNKPGGSMEPRSWWETLGPSGPGNVAG